jgi:selenocysteine lyase/cysteine desulfurase
LYVTPTRHHYLDDVEQRETAGTPNIVGIVRAGLALQIHRSLGSADMHAISHAYTMRAIQIWSLNPGIRLIGSERPAYYADDRMPIVSFNIHVRRYGDIARIAQERCFEALEGGDAGRGLGDSDTVMLHPNYVSKLLNDVYGIQVLSSR